MRRLERGRGTPRLGNPERCLTIKSFSISLLNVNSLTKVGREKKKAFGQREESVLHKGMVLEKYLYVWETAQTLA